MTELADLRNRDLTWQVDVLHKGRCAIYEGLEELGFLKRESFWRSSYSAQLGGLEWRLRNRFTGLSSDLSLDFADGGRGLAKAIRTVAGYGAEVDGVATYKFERSESFRGVWRDSDGYVAVSIAAAENRAMRLDWIRHGSIRVFEACPVAHAPALVLLALVPVLYERQFFSNL